MRVIWRPAKLGTLAPGGAYLASGSVSLTVPSAAMLASTWPAIALAIEPMRRTERPFGSVLLPGRVSPKPSTTDSSPRTAATTRPGAPELSASTVPIMDVASFRHEVFGLRVLGGDAGNRDGEQSCEQRGFDPSREDHASLRTRGRRGRAGTTAYRTAMETRLPRRLKHLR